MCVLGTRSTSRKKLATNGEHRMADPLPVCSRFLVKSGSHASKQKIRGRRYDRPARDLSKSVSNDRERAWNWYTWARICVRELEINMLDERAEENKSNFGQVRPRRKNGLWNLFWLRSVCKIFQIFPGTIGTSRDVVLNPWCLDCGFLDYTYTTE